MNPNGPLPRPQRTTRREFLAQSLTAGAAAMAPWIIPSTVLGKDGAVAASERIVLGGIGIGSRGSYVLRSMLGEKDVQFAAVCDVRAIQRNAVKAMAATFGFNDCATYRDFRELLGRGDIDAVLIATGERWHAVASAMAMRAGKDVYSEKPCGLDIGQCNELAAVVHRTGRVFQAGTHRRSVSNFQRAVQFAQSGKLGELRTLHASIYRPYVRYDWLPAEPEPPKDEVDWDMWLGPVAWRPFNREYLTGRRWQGHDDFSAGDVLLDWGAHTVDICQWANRADDTVPVEYVPSDKNITARYATGVTLVMDYLDPPYGQNMEPLYHTSSGNCCVRFEGTEGSIETGDNGILEVSPKSLQKELKALPPVAGISAGTHARNFFDCVKTRALPAAHAEIMRHSHIACFAAATAWRLGRPLTIDPVTASYQAKNAADEEANRTRTRALREPWRI